MSKLSKISKLIGDKSPRSNVNQWLLDIEKDLQQLYSALSNYFEVNHLVVGSSNNHLDASTLGNLSFVGNSGFYPRRISQSAQPTISDGEMVVWRDSDDDKVYIIYDDVNAGPKKVELT
jgi:hypothetical protein